MITDPKYLLIALCLVVIWHVLAALILVIRNERRYKRWREKMDEIADMQEALRR